MQKTGIALFYWSQSLAKLLLLQLHHRSQSFATMLMTTMRTFATTLVGLAAAFTTVAAAAAAVAAAAADLAPPVFYKQF